MNGFFTENQDMAVISEDLDYSIETVLIVDDDMSILVPVAEVLRHLGFTVETASDGTDAMNLLKKREISLVLTDMKMGKVSGFELINHISKEYPDVISIAMTGFTKEYAYIDVVNAGASDFINKPFSIEELEAKIRRAIIERNNKRELNQLSITDSLTGLFNQRYFYEKLKQETTRGIRQGYSVGLILMDLDYFKEYNDSHGHLAGDKVLKRVGKIISENIRQGVDSGYRYGGDEFAVIVVDAEPETWNNIMERIQKAIYDNCGITASTGFARYSEEMDSEMFVGEADRLLYENKGARKRLNKKEEGPDL